MLALPLYIFIVVISNFRKPATYQYKIVLKNFDVTAYEFE